MTEDQVILLAQKLTELGLLPNNVKQLLKLVRNVPVGFALGRLPAIGRERLVLILPYMTEGNAYQLLQLAEQYAFYDLNEIVNASSAPPLNKPTKPRLVRPDYT